jgi:hypothetical protein
MMGIADQRDMSVGLTYANLHGDRQHLLLQVGDPVLHIELTRWADGLMVVPMSANCLAKAANGLCDDLLTCVLRAWPPQKPLLLAPAMHHLMWQHPFNQTHIHAMLSNERCGLLLGDRIVFESPNNESEWQNFSACHVDRVAELVQDFLAMYPKSAAH